MEKPYILAALITSFTSLLLGLWNWFLSSRKHRKDIQIIAKQADFNKELEKIKSENQILLLKFKEELSNKKDNYDNKSNKELSVLKSLQLVKDSMHYFKNLLKQNGNALLSQDIELLKKTIFNYIKSYNSYYMTMDKHEKQMIHDLKNHLHQVITNIEVKQRLNKISESNTEAIVILNNCIIQISVIQKDLQHHYEK
jgi:hypothetical protein